MHGGHSGESRVQFFSVRKFQEETNPLHSTISTIRHAHILSEVFEG